MKILYSAYKDPSSNGQLLGFYNNCQHELRCAAFLDHCKYIKNIDWNLDAIYVKGFTKDKELREIFNYIKVNDYARIFIEDIRDWGPDIIISEGERFSAYIAKYIGIPLIYISPLLVLNSNMGGQPDRRFSLLPDAEYNFVNSPLSIIDCGIELSAGYDWVMPYQNDIYTNEKKEVFFSEIGHGLKGGVSFCETAQLMSFIRGEEFPILCPDDNNECKINYEIMKKIGFGHNLGFKINKNKLFYDKVLSFQLIKKKFKYRKVCQLHEIIEDLI